VGLTVVHMLLLREIGELDPALDPGAARGTDDVLSS